MNHIGRERRGSRHSFHIRSFILCADRSCELNMKSNEIKFVKEGEGVEGGKKEQREPKDNPRETPEDESDEDDADFEVAEGNSNESSEESGSSEDSSQEESEDESSESEEEQPIDKTDPLAIKSYIVDAKGFRVFSATVRFTMALSSHHFDDDP